jgi:hypothetical protein
MCTTATASLIVETIEKFCQDDDVFTAFDITKEVRAKTSERISHNDVRRIVVNELAPNADYDKDLCVLNVPSNPTALVYFPDGKSATDHPLVSAGTVVDDGTDVDDDDDDEEDDNNDLADDEYELTSEGRVEIPKTILTQVTANAGSYDILVKGSLKCVTPNADGRVRVCLKQMGISDKVTLSVDSTNNTINITS